jgi:hypothetical protein
VDTESGRGCLQVYGGIGASGEVGTRALFMLRRDGDELRLKVAAVPGALDVVVRVEVDGGAAGEFVVSGEGGAGGAAGGEGGEDGGAQVVNVALPAGARGHAVEIKLIPAHWAALANEDGGYRIASFRLVSAACEEG